MAIIKCPECGHQVSDKAPTCPQCGVEIADKLTRCPECGDVYFKDEPTCPSCHHVTGGNVATAHSSQPSPLASTPLPATDHYQPKGSEPKKPEQKKGSGWGALLASFIIALVVCGVCFYMYKTANDNKELQEYEFAAKSEDALVLQSFLDTYKDAPQAHIQAIETRLQAIKQDELDWQNAWKSNSKSLLEDYLRKHPNTPYRALAANKMDSLDWAQASGLNTVEAYQAYLDAHPDGNHYNQAEESMKAIRSKEVSLEERNAISSLFRRFFVSINERDDVALKNCVSEELTLLDKPQAGKADVVEMMNKMYKEEISKLLWRLNKDYTISKREIGDGQYEYAVSFTANKEEIAEEGAKPKNSQYRVNAKVNPDNLISELKMSKIVE